MAFLPPFGMINPLPTVNHNEFQAWVHGYKSRKQPYMAVINMYGTPQILIGYAPTGLVGGVLRKLLVGGLMAMLVATYYRVTPGAPSAPSIDRTIDDINQYIRELVRKNEGKRSGRPGPKKHMIPAPFKNTKRGPQVSPKPYIDLLKKSPTPFPPRERDTPETFANWFERKYGRRHPARYMRRWR